MRVDDLFVSHWRNKFIRSFWGVFFSLAQGTHEQASERAGRVRCKDEWMMDGQKAFGVGLRCVSSVSFLLFVDLSICCQLQRAIAAARNLCTVCKRLCTATIYRPYPCSQRRVASIGSAHAACLFSLSSKASQRPSFSTPLLSLGGKPSSLLDVHNLAATLARVWEWVSK
ncbi:hypothetical protein BKA80DRAFT_133548 [Phyllosticta citrichinensis]